MHLRGNLAQVVAQEVYDGGMLSLLLGIGEQGLLGLGQSGINGAFHGKGANGAIGDLNKRLRRKANKMPWPKEFVRSACRSVELRQREIGAHGHSKGEVGQKAIASMEVVLDDVKRTLVVAESWCRDFPLNLRRQG